jgi:putative membrane protein
MRIPFFKGFYGEAMSRTGFLVGASVLIVAFLVFSALHAYDIVTWVMEVAPVLIVAPLLWATYARYPLTDLLYTCICIHAVVLIVGGMYTYARVPLGFEMQSLFGLDRNPYDKVGHFVQGFVPALAVREILIRGAYIRGRRMLTFVVMCIVLAISASYELVEWGAAEAMEQDADDFLGTQGDPWDTQSDMLTALIGAAVSLSLCSRLHDRQLTALRGERD